MWTVVNRVFTDEDASRAWATDQGPGVVII